MTQTIQERLREPLVMSMFLSKEAIYQEQERQRAEAADRIDALERALEDMVKVAEFAEWDKAQTGRSIILADARAALTQGERYG